MTGILEGAAGSLGGHWALTAAEVGISERHAIVRAALAMQDFVLGRRYAVIFAGRSGSGKSVLAKYLAGDTKMIDYRRSEGVENVGARIKAGRLGITVWPGQASPARTRGILHTVDKHNAIGIVYVVCNGLTHTWEPEAPRILASRGLDTIEKYQERQRQEEVSAFNELRHYVKLLLRGHNKASWMVIAVTKADLWSDHLEDCANFYEYDPTSPFVQATEELLKGNRGMVKGQNPRNEANGRLGAV
jgi:hypothetical protein